MSVALVIAAILVVLAIGNSLVARLTTWRHPPIGRFVDVDSVRLHYLERGDGAAPPVVLFHGNGAMIQDPLGAGLIDLLAQRYRVIVFDRPGFGHSRRPRHPRLTPETQAALFAMALEKLDVRDPILLGHSWGTLIALALALRGGPPGNAPQGLVLVAGYYFPTWRPDVWLMSFPAIPIIGDIICYTLSPLLGWLLARAMIRSLFAPSEVPQAFTEKFPLALSLRPSQLRATAVESALMIPAAARLEAAYHRISCPLVIFHAPADTLIEPEQGPRLKQAIPAAVLHSVANTGHMLHYAIPGEIVGAIDDMVESRRPVVAR